MRSPGRGSESATTLVNVLSPEIPHVAQGQGFHFPEAEIGTCATGKHVYDVPGSESVAGKRTVHSGTWENRSVPTEASERTEEVMRKYVAAVVGLIHSRGVDRVMPVASKGIDTRRDWQFSAKDLVL